MSKDSTNWLKMALAAGFTPMSSTGATHTPIITCKKLRKYRSKRDNIKKIATMSRRKNRVKGHNADHSRM